MFFDADAEVILANQKLRDVRGELARFRLAKDFPQRPSPVLALFDAAVVRASQGSVRRHAERVTRFDTQA